MPRVRPVDELAVVEVVLRCFRPLLAAVLGAPEDIFEGDRLPLPTLVELAGTGCELRGCGNRVNSLVPMHASSAGLWWLCIQGIGQEETLTIAVDLLCGTICWRRRGTRMQK